jgi:hypothetical protein
MSAIYKHKGNNIQDYNFICCFVCVETWSLTFMEEHRLRILERRVVGRISGPKREKVTIG